jgi:hypothetical protein
MRDVHAKISHVLGWQKTGLLWEKSRAGFDGKMRSSGESVKAELCARLARQLHGGNRHNQSSSYSGFRLSHKHPSI